MQSSILILLWRSSMLYLLLLLGIIPPRLALGTPSGSLDNKAQVDLSLWNDTLTGWLDTRQQQQQQQQQHQQLTKRSVQTLSGYVLAARGSLYYNEYADYVRSAFTATRSVRHYVMDYADFSACSPSFSSCYYYVSPSCSSSTTSCTRTWTASGVLDLVVLVFNGDFSTSATLSGTIEMDQLDDDDDSDTAGTAYDALDWDYLWIIFCVFGCVLLVAAAVRRQRQLAQGSRPHAVAAPPPQTPIPMVPVRNPSSPRPPAPSTTPLPPSPSASAVRSPLPVILSMPTPVVPQLPPARDDDDELPPPAYSPVDPNPRQTIESQLPASALALSMPVPYSSQLPPEA